MIKSSSQCIIDPYPYDCTTQSYVEDHNKTFPKTHFYFEYP